MDSVAEIHLGTSAFTAAGWEGSFYPQGMKPAEYLTFYAEHFDTVEVDSTFYRCPSPQTVKGWRLKTPRDFIFSVKVPSCVTHEKVLVACDAEFGQFVDTMDILDRKLGPMVLQFPFFNRSVFKNQADFLNRLMPFLKRLPRDHKFAIEIRNKAWLDLRFADLLREHQVALVLQDQGWMPLPNQLSQQFDPVTTDWTYIRWLGDRKEIEKVTTTWNKVVVDRTEQLSWWTEYCYQTIKRGISIFAYANNHYAGFAPATIQRFRDLWSAKGLRDLWKPPEVAQRESSLFDF